jgi:sulfite reductase beta subunit-like hemoprotein
MNSAQLRYMGDVLAPYGEHGCADITTRASIQLRGVVLGDADRVIDGLKARGLHSFCSGMDNVRNLTGNPIAGAPRRWRGCAAGRPAGLRAAEGCGAHAPRAARLPSSR